MAGNKYIELSSGQLAEVEAIQSSAGAGDAGKIAALDAAGRFSTTMMPVGIGPDVKEVEAAEALVAGNLINFYDDSGTMKARKADCSNGRRAHGFVLSGFDSAATATVYLDSSINTALAALTSGTIYYLSTSGAVSDTAPSTAGYLSQEVGISLSATEMEFVPKMPVTLA